MDPPRRRPTALPRICSSLVAVGLLVGGARAEEASGEDPLRSERSFSLRPGETSAEHEWPVTFTGTLHVWTEFVGERPELSVASDDGSPLAEAEGERTPCVEVAVQEGAPVVIRIGVADSGESDVVLHVVASPESDELLAGSERLRGVLGEARELHRGGDPKAASALVVSALDEALAIDGAETSAELATALAEFGREVYRFGAIQPCARALDAARAHAVRSLPEDHERLAGVRRDLALVLKDLGQRGRSLELDRKVFAVRERYLDPDDLDLAEARENLAISTAQSGDTRAALEMFRAVLETRQAQLPPEHLQVIKAHENLAAALKQLGHLREARVAFEGSLAGRLAQLEEDHPDVQTSRANLALVLRDLGDYDAALELYEGALAARRRTLPPDHPDIALTLEALGVTLKNTGDLLGARDLQQQALEGIERALPAGHPYIQTARLNLASTARQLGDRARSRELVDLAARELEPVLDERNPRFVAVGYYLARSMSETGQREEASELFERVHALAERGLPEDHPYRIVILITAARELSRLGELERARERQERGLAQCERALPADHAFTNGLRTYLAETLIKQGELEAAREQLDLALASMLRTGRSESHPSVLAVRRQRIDVLWRLGETEELRADTLALAESTRAGLVGSIGRATPRELEEQVIDARKRIGRIAALSASRPDDGELRAAAFATAELARSVALIEGALAARRESEPELVALAHEERLVSGELAQASRSGGAPAQLILLREELESVRRRRSARLAEDPDLARWLEEPSAAVLGARVAESEALLAYHVLEGTVGEPRLYAFAVTHDGGSALLDLGPAAPVARLAGEWRASLIGSDAPSRGSSVGPTPASTSATDPGGSLRAAVIDPVRARFPEVTRFHVALDGPLHAVPLDALPAGEDRLGDAVGIRVLPTLHQLSWPARPEPRGEAVIFGGVAYDLDDESEPRGTASRGGPWEEGFAALPHAAEEARAIAELRESGARVFESDEASRDALFESAADARWLHLATHGWFAPESFSSYEDGTRTAVSGGMGLGITREEQLVGTSPMLLCGLALAGANAGIDERGHNPGLVTAEELSTLDLSGCELAVLSACDTSVGIERAGQGVASLQRALHVAGARRVIASLWKVSDEAARLLMIDLYRRLWIVGEPVDQALWNAKSTLREQGRPARDWAGWVLSGS